MILLIQILVAAMVAIPLLLWILWKLSLAVARAELRWRAKQRVDIAETNNP